MTLDQAYPMIATAKRLTHLLVSPRIGIAHKLELHENVPIAFGLSIADAIPSNMRGRDGGLVLPTCGGAAVSGAMASVAALMELAERYCGFFGADQRIHAGPAQDASYLWGARLGVFADWQYDNPSFDFRKHEPHASIRWMNGRSLIDGARRFLPAAWVQVPFFPISKSEQILCSTSSGMAAAFDYDTAIASGMLELFERDAFMVMWHHKIAMPAIRVSLPDLLGRAISSNVYDAGVELKFINLTNDLGVPVALCAMKRVWRGNTIHSIGAAARPSLRLACQKAFYEATTESHRQILELQSARPAWVPNADFSNVTDVSHHGTLYSIKQYMAELDFIWNMPETQEIDGGTVLPSEGRNMLRALLDIVRTNAMEAIAVSLSTPEIHAAGIKVVKLVMPQLVSFYADHRYPNLGADRIWSAAERLGVSVDPQHRRIPNPLPHPFA